MIEDHHLIWLEEVSMNSPVIGKVAKQAHEQLSLILPPPAATICGGSPPHSMIFCSWDRDEHHLELEIYDNGVGEWFYRNRHTAKFWGDDWTIGTPVCKEVVFTALMF